MTRMTFAVCAAGLLGLTAALPASTQVASAPPQQPIFRTGTRPVPVYATVTDAAGRLVPDLEQADFEIYDNGKKQPITIFGNQTVNFAAALALDTSASMTMNIEFVQEAAVQFVVRMLPEDKGIIGFFNSKVQFGPELTSDRDRLISHIRNKMQVGNETRLWDAVDGAMNQLADATGRKVVVALTDGEDWGSSLGDGEVRERAQREDVMVYAIGIESLFNNGERMVLTRPGRSFRRLASETGGGYFELKKSAELNSTFTRVIQELHSQYVLGFAPPALDGKSHKLELRLVKPGLTARARQSYVAK
jgi:Ca-activated chloride channel family protein